MSSHPFEVPPVQVSPGTLENTHFHDLSHFRPSTSSLHKCLPSAATGAARPRHTPAGTGTGRLGICVCHCGTFSITGAPPAPSHPLASAHRSMCFHLRGPLGVPQSHSASLPAGCTNVFSVWRLFHSHTHPPHHQPLHGTGYLSQLMNLC